MNCDGREHADRSAFVAPIEFDDEPRDGVQEHVEPERAARVWLAPAFCGQQEHEDQELRARLIQLRRVKRDAERRADIAGRKWVGERNGPRFRRRLAEAAAGKKAPEAADDVAERDSRRKHIARRPEREADATDVPQRDRDREDQPAVEYAALAREVQQLRRVGAKRREVRDEQKQLRADERGDDDVDAQIENARLVEPACFCPADCQLQAEEIGRRQQDAVGVNRDRAEFKQSWIHGCPYRACRES